MPKSSEFRADPTKLASLTQLRQAQNLTLTDMARLCGLSGRRSREQAGQWESGKTLPSRRRRHKFLVYLLDSLNLRQNPKLFLKIWSILVEEWEWEALSEEERQTFLHPDVLKNPYRGLEAFTEADTAYFFGREEVVKTLKQAVSQQPYTIILGSSGSGKTSVIQAGLVPQLRQEQNCWTIVQFRPGQSPYRSLADGLVAVAYPEHSENGRANKANQLTKEWSLGNASPAQTIQTLPLITQAEHVLLIIDQFEELFTTCPEPEVAEQFINNLLVLEKNSDLSIKILLAMRADFLDEALSVPALSAVLNRYQLLLPPMTQDELEAAIQEPAHSLFIEFEEGLLRRILLDVGNAPGKLILLEFALTQLWNHQANETGYLTLAAYEAIGRVQGALINYAEAVFNELAEPEQQQAARLFLQLVKPSRQHKTTRLLASRAKVGEEGWALAAKLATFRLVITDIEGEEYAEIIHEALIDTWPRLSNWIETSRDFRIWQEDLRLRNYQWQESGEDAGILLRGSQLTTAEDWLKKRPYDLTEEDYNFILASGREEKRQREQELEQVQNLANSEKRRSRTFRVAAVIAIFLTVVAVIFAVSATQNAQLANAASTRAIANEAEALAAEADAVAAQSTAEREAIIRTTAEAEALTEADRANKAQATAQAEQLRAENEAAVSRSRELAARSITQTDINAELGLLLAIEAGQAADTFEATNAIRQAIMRPGRTAHIAIGHEADVWHIAWHPDGTRYVTASSDGTARIWDADTGEELLALVGHQADVWQAAWDPSGERIVTASADGTARIWDANSGKTEIVLAGHLDTVWQAEWDATGSRIVTASGDGTARVWDATTGDIIVTLTGHTGQVSFVAWDPTGTRIATAGWTGDGTARVWDATSGKELAVFRGHTEPVPVGIRNVAWDPQGERLVTSGGDGLAFIWDAATGDVLVQLAGPTLFGAPHDPIRHVAWSPRGTAVLTTSTDNMAEVWDATTGERISLLSGHTDWVVHAAWHEEGSFILTSSWDGTARVWDALTGVEITRLTGHTAGLNLGVWSPDGEYIATASSDSTARVWHFTYGVEGSIFYDAFTLLGSLHHVAWDSTGTRVVVAGEYGGAQVWNAESDTKEATFSGHDDWVYDAAWNKSDTQILTAGNDHTARIWEAATGMESVVFSGHTGAVLQAEWNNAETQVVTASADGTARIWDAATGAEVSLLSGHTAGINYVAWNGTDTRIVTASEDGTARIWDAATGQEVAVLSGHTAAVNQAVWNPAGTHIATASDDNTARVWDATTGSERTIFSSHQGSVEHIMWNQAGTQLLTASSDDTARIWDSETGQEQLLLSGHMGSLTFASWSPDETRIVTTSWDNTARVWDATTGAVVAILGGHADGRFTWVDHAAWDPAGARLVTAASDGTARLFYLHTADLVEAACQQAVRNMTRDEWRLNMGDMPYRETCPGI